MSGATTLREHLEAIIADKDDAYGVAHDMVKHAAAALAILDLHDKLMEPPTPYDGPPPPDDVPRFGAWPGEESPT